MLKKVLFALLLALGVAGAQPLAGFAPQETVLSLSFGSQGGVLETLDDDLSALGWEQGKETLRKLLEVGARLGDGGYADGDFTDLLNFYDTMMGGTDGNLYTEEVLAACPGLQDVADASQDYRGKGYRTEGLLTLSLDGFSPVPAGTALLRVDDALAPLYEQLQGVLLECIRETDEVTELEQDGVTLYVVGDAGDFPIVAGNVGTLYFLGSNPEVVRGVVRKVQGAAEGSTRETSYADTPFYQQVSARLGETVNGLGFAVNSAALAGTLEGAAGFLGGDPETDYLVTRAGTLLRTLGGMAGNLSLTDEGVQLENVLAVNPAGGDEALLELLLCDTCTVSAPFLAPQDSVGVAAQYLPWRELFAYAQDWLDGLAAVTGEPLDLKQLAQDTFGIDLDTALLDWLGSEVQTYTLDSSLTDLRTLLYGQAQVSVVPVSSPAAAKAGLESLARTFGPILNELLTEAGGMGDVGSAEDLFGATNLLGETAVTTYTYKDTEITRLRAGYNTDVGYTFVGNYLVLGSPRAVEGVVDAFGGGRAFSFGPGYRAMRAELPETVSSFSYGDTAAGLNGLADLLEVFVQPAAFATDFGLEAAVATADDPNFDSLGYADLYEVTPVPLSAPGSVEGVLSEDDLDYYGSYSVYYDLTDLEPGAQVSVSLGSDAGDVYLSLIDADAEVYLADGEYGDDYITSELTFSAEEGRRYYLEVVSYDVTETGDYTLSVSVEQGTPQEATPEESQPLSELDLPSYGELLSLFDLLPRSVRVLADHTSTSESYSETDGDTVYTRSLTRVVW